VYLACRDKEKTERVIRQLEEETSREAIFIQLDLASLSSVKAAAEEFLKLEPELHVLFNNAGAMATPMGVFTEDGYDYQFGANHLGHFYFTKLLVPALKAGAQSSGDDVSRVVTISSQAHILTKTIHFDALKDGSARNKMTPEQLYSHSKFVRLSLRSKLPSCYYDILGEYCVCKRACKASWE